MQARSPPSNVTTFFSFLTVPKIFKKNVYQPCQKKLWDSKVAISWKISTKKNLNNGKKIQKMLRIMKKML